MNPRSQVQSNFFVAMHQLSHATNLSHHGVTEVNHVLSSTIGFVSERRVHVDYMPGHSLELHFLSGDGKLAENGIKRYAAPVSESPADMGALIKNWITHGKVAA